MLPAAAAAREYASDPSPPSRLARSAAAFGRRSRGSARAALRSAPCSKYDSSCSNGCGSTARLSDADHGLGGEPQCFGGQFDAGMMLASSAAAATAAGASHWPPGL